MLYHSTTEEKTRGGTERKLRLVVSTSAIFRMRKESGNTREYTNKCKSLFESNNEKVLILPPPDT